MLTVALLLLWTLAGAHEMTAPEPADLVLVNGTFHTLDLAVPRAEAVAVRGERIIYVGDAEGAMKLKGPSTRRVDLAGAAVVPGFIDAHGHVSGLGFLASRLDLAGTRSAQEVAGTVARRAARLRPGEWIRGRGWDQNDWEEASFPTRQALDAAAPDNPVALERIDGHATWANTKAIRIAGVTKETPDPPGGQILRDASGEPTGIFVDGAEELILGRVPPPTRLERKEALRLGMQRCLEAGLTGVHDAGVSVEELELYRELLVEGDLPFRVYAMLAGEPAYLESLSGSSALAGELRKGPVIGLGGGRLTVRALKLYIDGALGSRGAALMAPYQDDPGNTGLLRMEPARLREVAERAARSGFQVCVHAIGDRGNHLALDALEAARKAGGGDPRFRIEHAQILAPGDIPRFASLGIIASMQPTHATSDMYWASDRLGPDRVRGGYAWRSLIASGARLACGSDFPVESERPLLGFYAAVTRQDPKGWPEGGWYPGQRMSREEALRCFTQDAAYAAFEEGLRGSISVGKLADLTVLTRDVMTVPAPEILETAVRMTIVGGRIAYQMP